MRILWVATKPPAPPADGGRLLQLLTLEALAARGARITLVAPADPGGAERGRPAAAAASGHDAGAETRDRDAGEDARRDAGAERSDGGVREAAGRDAERAARRDAGAELSGGRSVTSDSAGRLTAVCTPHLVAAPAPSRLRALLAREPFTIARHRRPAVAEEVARRLAAERFDAVHAEQAQALPQAAAAFARGVPVVLRAQNVESDLWRAVAARGGLRGRLAGRAARGLAAWEGRAAARAAVTIALTAADAARLAELAGRGSSIQPAARIERVPAPFPAELPAADTPLPGAPAVVLVGSGGWLPNREAARWFVAAAWPAVRAALPGAVLHRFDGGPAAPGVVAHPPPADSRAAFAPGAVLAVPLAIASGVRMKILEAWSRGLPVVASPAAAAGLEAADGRELLLADGAAGFAAALARLERERGLAARLVAAGRAALAARHDPGAVADRLLALYASAGAAASRFGPIASP